MEGAFPVLEFLPLPLPLTGGGCTSDGGGIPGAGFFAACSGSGSAPCSTPTDWLLADRVLQLWPSTGRLWISTGRLWISTGRPGTTTLMRPVQASSRTSLSPPRVSSASLVSHSGDFSGGGNA